MQYYNLCLWTTDTMNVLFCLILLTYNGNICATQNINVKIKLVDHLHSTGDGLHKLKVRSPEIWKDGTFNELNHTLTHRHVLVYEATIRSAEFAGLRSFEQFWLANMKLNGKNLQCATSVQHAESGAKCCKIQSLEFGCVKSDVENCYDTLLLTQ
ncbi:hypothetical protein EG68_07157 [Paragonimus skrjabini miyazakii]|uniref:Uncharacterized protein n=1 Tax=Paragonimus skrjabini miyazakii TaxID=59628 RepID=A0A8S9YZ77_9TREM|nr:hypothetical protein EG68_07157 [Paragonimus skrjabini miyazakii]